MKMTRREFGMAAGAAAGAAVLAGAAGARPRLGSIRRMDARLDEVIAVETPIEQIASGFKWSEGPVWVKQGNYLLFSDVPGNVVHRWSEAEGQSEWLRPAGLAGDTIGFREPGSNGLIIDNTGALLMADHGNRCISRVDLATKRKTPLVERFGGKRFNSPNDLVQARNGAIFFTDPPYGLEGIDKSPLKEQPVNGIYRWTPDGQVELVDGTVSFPNGIGLSPDERTLYIGVSDSKKTEVLAFTLGSDGQASAKRTFFDATPLKAAGGKGLCDGLKVDPAGRVFATGPGGVLVLSPEGTLLGVIDPGKATANCGFGEDGRTLFLTSSDVVCRVRLKTPGW